MSDPVNTMRFPPIKFDNVSIDSASAFSTSVVSSSENTADSPNFCCCQLDAATGKTFISFSNLTTVSRSCDDDARVQILRIAFALI